MPSFRCSGIDLNEAQKKGARRRPFLGRLSPQRTSHRYVPPHVVSMLVVCSVQSVMVEDVP